MQKFNAKKLQTRKKKKKQTQKKKQDFIICHIISHCLGQHDEKLYPMPARQHKYIHCTVTHVISEPSHWVSISPQLETYIQKMASFCLSNLALHSQTCICTLSTNHHNHKGFSSCFPAENNVLNPKSFCTHKQSCLWAKCSKQTCLPAQNCMWTKLSWRPSKNPV